MRRFCPTVALSRCTTRGRAAWCVGIAAWALVLGGPALGEEPSAPPPPGLDQLLKLPTTLDYGVERRGGSTRSEWRTRFTEAGIRLSNAEAALQVTQDELAKLGGETDAWKMGPPGMGAAGTDAPLSYQLRQDLHRQQAEVDQAGLRLRELEVEANLAGVPPDWRGPRTEPQLADDSGIPPGDSL